MTIEEMHQEFLVGVDKSNSLEYPDFLPEEIDIFINKSQDAIVKQRYSGNNPKRESVEETQKRMDDLRELIKSVNTTVAYTVNPLAKPNGRFVDLPTDYWFTLQDEITFNYTDCHDQTVSTRVEVVTTTHDRWNKIKNDPFNKPNEKRALKLYYSNDQVEIILGGSPVVSTDPITYHLRYLSRPVPVSYSNGTDCVLSDHLHREIVDYAVNLALENIESQRFKTQIVELNRNE